MKMRSFRAFDLLISSSFIPHPSSFLSPLSPVICNLLRWLSQRLAPPNAKETGGADGGVGKPRRATFLIACAAIFLTAFSVRSIQWQDNRLTVGDLLGSIVQRYQRQAAEILDGQGILFTADPLASSNTPRLIHPPGYPIFIAAIYRIFGASITALTVAQWVCDSLSAVAGGVLGGVVLPPGAGG